VVTFILVTEHVAANLLVLTSLDLLFCSPEDCVSIRHLLEDGPGDALPTPGHTPSASLVTEHGISDLPLDFAHLMTASAYVISLSTRWGPISL
jgi:hypothetical protein